MLDILQLVHEVDILNLQRMPHIHKSTHQILNQLLNWDRINWTKLERMDAMAEFVITMRHPIDEWGYYIYLCFCLFVFFLVCFLLSHKTVSVI